VRTAFIKTLTELARADKRIFLLISDVGYGVVDEFAQAFSKRFINVGLAEQNMIGIAAGLGLSGKIVFVYSIANFPTMRCLEQIRNDVCYHNLSVKVVAVGGGLTYGALGPTHHGTEDLAIMRSLPHMTVIAPGDSVESALATRAIYEKEGPCYLRLERAGERVVYNQNIPEFQIGKAIKVREGNDVTLISIGGILFRVLQAAESLAKKGIEARVLSMHTLKPLDVESVIVATRETGGIITIEEHSVIGGLGSAVSEVLAERTNGCVAFEKIGLNNEFCHQIGCQDYLRDRYRLSIDNIAEVANKLMHQVAR
jgi:transketolase